MGGASTREVVREPMILAEKPTPYAIWNLRDMPNGPDFRARVVHKRPEGGEKPRHPWDICIREL